MTGITFELLEAKREKQNRKKTQRGLSNDPSGVGGFQVFPPPSTPPEPAPPDLEADCGPSSGLKALSSAASRPRWQLQHGTAISSSLPTASSSHTSLDEAACMRLPCSFSYR